MECFVRRNVFQDLPGGCNFRAANRVNFMPGFLKGGIMHTKQLIKSGAVGGATLAGQTDIIFIFSLSIHSWLGPRFDLLLLLA